MLKSASFTSCVCSSKSKFSCSSFHPLFVVYYFLKIFVQPVKCPHGRVWELTTGSTPLDERQNQKKSAVCGLFHIRTTLISARRPDLEIVKKNIIYQRMNFAIPGDHWVKIKESDLVRKLKKIRGTWTIVVVVLGRPQKLGKKIEGIGNQRKKRNHTDHSSVEIG